MEVNLVGDAKETLSALLPLIDQKSNGAWRDGVVSNVKEWWNTLEERAMQPADPVNPQRVTWELSPRLPERRDRHQRLRLLRQLVSRATSRYAAA